MIATVMTHRRVADTRPALDALHEIARGAGATLRLSAREVQKHALTDAEGLELGSSSDEGVDICFVLGGDGTILAALRRYAGTGVPVFAVNFGEIGFLATVEPEGARAGFEHAFAGDYEVLALPGIAVRGAEESWIAINDVAFQRKQGRRVANLAYAVGDDEVGRVRCDGLVVATPAGSTGYNLANGGPVMAWGVEGMVVSFIAPHSLTARSLVVAPADVLTIHNRTRGEEVDVVVDGRPVVALETGSKIDVKFVDDQGRLAQLAGSNFYRRMSEKFGRLATVP